LVLLLRGREGREWRKGRRERGSEIEKGTGGEGRGE